MKIIIEHKPDHENYEDREFQYYMTATFESDEYADIFSDIAMFYQACKADTYSSECVLNGMRRFLEYQDGQY